MILISLIFVFVVIHSFFITQNRTVRNDVIQGILLGGGMALVTIYVYGRFKTSRVNGWITMYGCNMPGNGIIKQAACYMYFPGPINVLDVYH